MAEHNSAYVMFDGAVHFVQADDDFFYASRAAHDTRDHNGRIAVMDDETRLVLRLPVTTPGSMFGDLRRRMHPKDTLHAYGVACDTAALLTRLGGATDQLLSLYRYTWRDRPALAFVGETWRYLQVGAEATAAPAVRAAVHRADLAARALAQANFELLVKRQEYDAARGAHALRESAWKRASKALYGAERTDLCRTHGLATDEKS